ncbi:uncharacterized protein LOC144038112 [Vanacampus margaritifer]
MMERQIRTTVPVLEETLLPRPVNPHEVSAKDATAEEQYRFFYNWRHSACPLPELLPGQDDRVKIDGEKAWKTPAKVISKSVEPRSYLIETDDGAVLCRNRHHLQAVPGAAHTEEQLQQPGAKPASPRQVSSSPDMTCVGPKELIIDPAITSSWSRVYSRADNSIETHEEDRMRSGG